MNHQELVQLACKNWRMTGLGVFIEAYGRLHPGIDAKTASYFGNYAYFQFRLSGEIHDDDILAILEAQASA